MSDATYRDPSGHLKPWKHGPKQYKSGPGPTGAARLSRQVASLVLQATRLEKKAEGAESAYARALREALQAFLRAQQAEADTRFRAGDAPWRGESTP